MAEMIVGARNRVDVPAPAVSVGGFLAAARVIDSNDPHDLLGAEYESDACAAVQVWEEWCISSPICVTGTEALKDFDTGYTIIEGDPFALYTGIECDFARLSEYQRRAANRFNYGERAGVDMAIYDRLASLPAIEDLGGPVPLPQAIGLVEMAAARLYGGVPIIVVPIGMVPCGCDNGVITRGLDGSLVTCQGSLVANVVTPDDVTPASTTIYAIGALTIIRGPMMTFAAPSGVDCDGNPVPPRALAERLYVPLIECFAAKAEATCG